MRIPCPYCGERDVQEFSYLGDATLRRPDPSAPGAGLAFHDYVYLRDNPAGPHREFWQHVQGCRSWLVVERDTRTHEITKARYACEREVRA
jgi:sarcosine oxidase subunit delta